MSRLLRVFLRFLVLLLWLLLILLALIFGILLCILLLPVRYKGSIKKDADQIQGALKLSWMWIVLSAGIVWKDNEPVFSVRFFGLPVLKILKRRKEKKERKAERRRRRKLQSASVLQPASRETYQNTGDSDMQSVLSQEKNVSKPDSGRKKRVKKPSSKWKGLIRRIKEKADSVLQAVRKAVGMIKEGNMLLHSDMVREARQTVFHEGIHILRHIAPHIRGWLCFGLDDPYQTGRITGWLSFIYPVMPKKLTISPDFTKSILEGDLKVSGRIRIGYVLWHIWKIYRNKGVRRLITYFKQRQV